MKGLHVSKTFTYETLLNLFLLFQKGAFLRQIRNNNPNEIVPFV